MPTKDPGQAYVGKIRNGKKLKWRPHPVMLSINVDAATDIEKKFARLGAIIRDLNDKVVAAAVRNSELWTDTSSAEAELLEWGLQLAKEAGFASSIIETN